MVRVAIPLVLLLVLSACGQSRLFNRFSDPDGYWLPLTIDLHMDSSVTDAGIPYTDACRQSQTLAIGNRLQDALRREISTVFERVNANSAPSPRPPDGVVDVSLGLKEVDLFIPRQATKSYPATVTLGSTVVYIDSNGETLYTKNLRAEAQGTVDTTSQHCDVQGLHTLANQAAATLAQGLKKHLGTSTKIRDAAQARQDPYRIASVTAGSSNAAAPSSSGSPVSLLFRVMLEDENQDQILQSGEAISLEVEISNTGGSVAEDVTLTLSGTLSLVRQFTQPDPVGSLRPGETRRIVVQGTAPDAEAAAQAELIVSVQALSSMTDVPNQKKFQVALEPKQSTTDAALDVDVDRIPERVSGYERRKAVGISVGIGTFRNGEVPAVQFAARDAEVMAQYFETVAGIPQAQVRLATDDHALKDDLVELFEDWLPEQTASGGVVFIFLAGRGMVNPATGAVSLIPHEADPASVTRLYSLRRLYEALARLPIQRAVLLMDLTLSEPSLDGAQNGKGPVWDAVPPALRKDKLIQVVGINGLQEAHQYEEGRHGLFTYFLLKGLGGAADADDNGIVAAGELCGYVREQVLQVAKEHFNNAQEPACLPVLGAKAKASQFALGRVK
ncbi:MAG: hypothetical protein ACREJU_18800 [Nitrospiraceae bacterium]